MSGKQGLVAPQITAKFYGRVAHNPSRPEDQRGHRAGGARAGGYRILAFSARRMGKDGFHLFVICRTSHYSEHEISAEQANSQAADREAHQSYAYAVFTREKCTPAISWADIPAITLTPKRTSQER